MSTIIAEFDSVKKTCVVKMDGKTLADAESVGFYYCDPEKYGMEDVEPYWCCNIGMCTEDEENQTKTHTSIMARQSKEGRDALKNGASTLLDDKNQDTGFVVGHKKEITEALGAYLKTLRSK